MTTKDQKLARERWIDMLESDDPKWNGFKLRQGKTYLAYQNVDGKKKKQLNCCCLGVSCLIEGVKTKVSKERISVIDGQSSQFWSFYGEKDIEAYPEEDWFSDKYGLERNLAEEFLSYCVTANDNIELTFPQIAAFLRSAFRYYDRNKTLLSLDDWLASKAGREAVPLVKSE